LSSEGLNDKQTSLPEVTGLNTMNIHFLGTSGPRGWPEAGCRCASCAALRAAGARFEPTRVEVDGVPLEECPRLSVPGGWDVEAPGGGRLLVAAGPGECPSPAPGRRYDAVLLDLAGDPGHLGLLRHVGAVTPLTEVHAVHLDHRLRSPAELERRLRWWTRPRPAPHRTLLLGGARSGKSAEAELRFAAEGEVTYVATAAHRDDDPEWIARITAHQERRPSWWRTAETTDLAGLLGATGGSILIDGLGTWLASVMDARGAWEDPAAVRPALDALVEAWRAAEADVVAVTDEVGQGIVPATASGRLFRDLLGTLNQRLAAESEEVALVVAGRLVHLP
jgi:adenosylcobinamide kinase/adenosylcobinamide-phosphate guanylyltransferase